MKEDDGGLPVMIMKRRSLTRRTGLQGHDENSMNENNDTCFF